MNSVRVDFGDTQDNQYSQTHSRRHLPPPSHTQSPSYIAEMDNLKRRQNAVPATSHHNGALYSQVVDDDEDEDKPAYVPERLDEKTYKPPRPRVYSSNTYIRFWQMNESTLIPVILTLLSFWTRFRIIGKSNIVVWDEAHFGKFGSHYIRREFYFDVHPPLGKILVGFSGMLAGYDGSFDFKSGETYPETVNYTFMRIFGATFGALMVPIAYFTAYEFRFSKNACVLAAIMVLLDTAYLTISRFILLDSMLLFFTCTSLYTLSVFHNLRDEPFSIDWWLWLGLTGLSLGCVSSVKWVGLFAVALVGIYTIEDLWRLFGDLNLPKSTYLKHWIARAICLIVLPMTVYMFSFWLHFAILNHSGSGDAQMSSLFQANLVGSPLRDSPFELAYGSKVTFKNFGYGGGLLHSHIQTFPEGSGQQQVTCYHHKDSNNDWIIHKPRGVNPADANVLSDHIEYVKDGDVVRIVHASTGRNLHSHNIKAPATTSQNEVSCYGNATIGDSNDHWKIEVVDDVFSSDHSRIRTLTTRMRFRHVNLGCLLNAENVVLPQWAFKQVEVTCDKRNRTTNPHTWWNIEQHWNDKLPPAPPQAYRSRFLEDFWHLNVAMWTSNNALVPDPDKEDILSSSPTEWPLLQVGLRMCSWADNVLKFYLLGNPVVWWSAALSILAFSGFVIAYIVRMQRRIFDMSAAQWDHFFYVGKCLTLGWALHYIPFGIMGRVTYLHHYFPALYFSILMVPFLLDHVTRQRSAMVRNMVFSVAMAIVIGVFLYFADCSFGIEGSNSVMKGRKWLDSWNIVD